MRTTFSLFCLFVVFCVTLTHAKLYPFTFEERSVFNDMLKPLHPNGDPEIIKECGITVTKPYGQLEQIYKRDQVVAGTTCVWKLQAPAKHRIHIISLGFDLLDSVVDEPSSEQFQFNTSTINTYDSEKVEEYSTFKFYINRVQKGKGYVRSLSTKEVMTVEIKYGDNPDYATQHIRIKYEFLPADKIHELFML